MIGRTVRLAKVIARFDSVLRITDGVVALEMVAEEAEKATVPVPVFVTEIAALAVVAAAALSLTVTEIV